MMWLSLTTNMLVGLLFARAYGGSYWDWAYSVIQTSDNGYAIAGPSMARPEAMMSW